jgi:hypothetical protein
MKPLAKYVKLLERDVEDMREQLAQARADTEFYRGKVERLELIIVPGKSPSRTSAISVFATISTWTRTPSERSRLPPHRPLPSSRLSI